MKTLAFQSAMSHERNPAMARNDTSRVARSQPGCIPFQQLVHRQSVPTWPSVWPWTGLRRPTRRLSSASSANPELLPLPPSFLYRTHSEPRKATPTMPKHTKSYHSTSSAIARVSLRSQVVMIVKPEIKG